ncbi:MAG: nucleoside triphosphate pyrophosphohydrolase [Niameybacter sp.]
MGNEKYTYQDLIGIIETLRGENGCAWDKEQTHETLTPCIIEEAYELVEAVQNKDMVNLKEELGDVLLQVLMHAQIASENNAFTMEDVVDGIATKLVYRHPHVFNADEQTISTEKILENWEILKKKEKQQKTETQAMDEVARALPALMRAYKVQKKAAKVGFTWDTYEPIINKIFEEIDEL